ncbi:MAG: hypothetical protein KBT03_11455 [Bacteroidales bacterium]|nr:hypothetical protein [Candidatus Scybalousia scybalohippi]
MNNILDVLNNQLPFVYALVIGVVAHTLGGGIKHKKDFNWKKLLDGTIDLTMILATILLVIVGIYCYEPLIKKFAEEMETLKVAICIGVYAKSIILVKEYFDVKDEDMKEAEKYIDTRNYGEE